MICVINTSEIIVFILLNQKINKIIWYIYDESIRRKICNYYYKTIDDSSKYFNRTNIWFKVSKEDILNLDNKLINYPTKHSSKF